MKLAIDILPVDVAKLVGDPAVLSDVALKKILKEYNQENLQYAKTPEGTSVRHALALINSNIIFLW